MDAISREAIEAMLESMERRETLRRIDPGMPIVMLTGPVPDVHTMVLVEEACRQHGFVLVPDMHPEALPDRVPSPTAFLFEEDIAARRVMEIVALREDDIMESVRRIEKVCLKDDTLPQHREKGFYRRFEKKRMDGGYSRGKRRK